MPGKLENRVAFWATVVASITVLVAIAALFSSARFIAISGQVEHSHEIIQRLKDLKGLAKDAESGQRGYFLSDGDESYLKPYLAASATCDRKLSELRTLTAEDSGERRRLADDLKPLLSAKFAVMDETIRLHRLHDEEAALGLLRTNLGEQIMSEIEQRVDAGASSERKRLASSGREALFVRNLKIILNLISVLFTVSILVAVYHVVNREMRDRKRAEEGLARARDVAEAASLAKGNFMANVSHEIRTPMNAILGMTELTLETDLAPQQRENLQIVKSATDSLLAIINDLLDFSRMEAGKLELAVDDFSLREHLEDTLDLLGLKAVDKGLELACRVAPGVPDQLLGDASRLRQVLVNLVGNAIKFTEAGEVVVEVEVEAGPRPAGAVVIHFRVTDSGIGIASEKQELVFAPFTQADGSTTRFYGGTGLGLAISTQLVGLMGGKIWVESELGRGSTFHFTASFSASGGQLTPRPASLESLNGLRVLVVDDNAVNRRILGEILLFWGMVPTLADGGRRAILELERARDAGAPIALVLLDALMPDIDGFYVARLIKQDMSLKPAVLLMLTSSDREGFAEIARAAGITACLNKPIYQNKLLDAILASVTNAPLSDSRRRAASATEPARSRSRPLRILMAEDNPHNQRVAVLILAKSGHAVTVAGDGREAVDFLRRGSFDLVLMDLQMPLMDGMQATAAIRAAEVGTSRRIPIIALTAHAMKEDEDRCLAAGMDGYVSKPIQEKKLLQAIDDCLYREREPLTDHSEQDESVLAKQTMDLASALDKVGGDRGFLNEMAGLFRVELPTRLAEIRDALDRGDIGSLVTPAHSLKNWAGNFVAEASFAALTRLEGFGKVGDIASARSIYQEVGRELERLAGDLSRFQSESGSSPENVGVTAIGHSERRPPCTL